jgi:NAD(P)-dependent dehydrogenase (short-subunit alcohol dehydrogenase family)
VTSSVHLAKRVVRDMVTRKKGKILFTSSTAGTMPAPFEAVYGALKAFLLSFSEALRNELEDSGVTVTALMPGATEPNFFRRAGMQDTKVGTAEKDGAADVARDGYEALMAGEDKVIAGSFKNKMEGGLGARILPASVKATIHRKMAEPGSAEKKIAPEVPGEANHERQTMKASRWYGKHDIRVEGRYSRPRVYGRRRRGRQRSRTQKKATVSSSHFKSLAASVISFSA